MSLEANIALVSRFLAVHDAGDVSELDELLAADYVHHDPGFPDELQHGRDAYKQLVAALRAGFPDLQGTVEDVFGAANKIAAQWSARGTHWGDLLGLPPTGTPVAFSALFVHRITAGKIDEGWVYYDGPSPIEQIGAVRISGGHHGSS